MASSPDDSRSGKALSIRYKLVIIESLVVAVPFLTFTYVIYAGNYQFKLFHLILVCFILVLILSGLLILNKIFDNISAVASNLKAETKEISALKSSYGVSELRDINDSFGSMVQKLETTSQSLSKRVLELQAIQGLVEAAKKGLLLDDLLGFLLEKCMTITGAKIGSILVDESVSSGSFRVAASRGHNENLKSGSYVSITDPLSHIVVAEKKPLLIRDIENDPRMLKANNPFYGPPSFLSMPLAIGDDVVAVLNLAHKETGELFDFNDEHVLSIMIGEISVVLENGLLHSKIEDQLKNITNHNLNLAEEIAVRRRTEEALQESEKKYRLLVENSNDIILTTDMEGCFTYVNSVAEEETGYTRSELIGKHYATLVRADFHDKIQAHYNSQLLEKKLSTYFEFPGVTKYGEEKWLGQNAQLLFENGIPTGFQAIARNISKRKEAEDKLRAYAAEIEDLYNNAPCGYHSLSPDGTFLRMNDTELKWLGYGRDEIVGKKKFDDLITPESRERFQKSFPLFKKQGWINDREYDLIRKDGSILPVRLSATAVMDATGNYIMSRSATVDITERRVTERKLYKSNLSLAEAQRIAHIGNWEWDIQTDEMFWSDEVYRILGFQPLEFKGTKTAFLSMIHPGDLALVEQTLNKSSKADIQHRVLRCDGSMREVNEKIEKTIDENGAPRLLGIIQDVTEHNFADRELQKAKDFLAQADKLTSIGRMSTAIAHEILNPVNIISIELQMFKNLENLPPGMADEIAVCMDQIQRIVNIAESLKQFSRMPTQKLSKTDINAMLDRVLTFYSYEFQVEGIELESQYEPDLPEVSIDREKIEQVIFNLITNALTAMEKKEKKLLRICTQKALTSRGDFIRVTISDTGTGVEKEIKQRLFEPFFTTQEYGRGTGLGLFISYGIIQEHGGNIWEGNNEWGGASFFVELPLI